MFDPADPPLSDTEFAAVLRTALRAGGGGVTHAGSCHMAAIVAEHLVERLAEAGIQAVRVPSTRLTE